MILVVISRQNQGFYKVISSAISLTPSVGLESLSSVCTGNQMISSAIDGFG